MPISFCLRFRAKLDSTGYRWNWGIADDILWPPVFLASKSFHKKENGTRVTDLIPWYFIVLKFNRGIPMGTSIKCSHVWGLGNIAEEGVERLKEPADQGVCCETVSEATHITAPTT